MDTLLYFGMGVTALAATTVTGLIALRAFTKWIALKHSELERAQGNAAPTIGQRIDVADLKERVRRLEAIAAGVDI